jgi:hypothetical protein
VRVLCGDQAAREGSLDRVTWPKCTREDILRASVHAASVKKIPLFTALQIYMVANINRILRGVFKAIVYG